MSQENRLFPMMCRMWHRGRERGSDRQTYIPQDSVHCSARSRWAGTHVCCGLHRKVCRKVEIL